MIANSLRVRNFCLGWPLCLYLSRAPETRCAPQIRHQSRYVSHTEFQHSSVEAAYRRGVRNKCTTHT
jgi:hypothetical protein